MMGTLNIEKIHLSHISVATLFRERLMHLPLISFLTELCHLLDISAVAGHGAVLAALLFSVLRVHVDTCGCQSYTCRQDF